MVALQFHQLLLQPFALQRTRIFRLGRMNDLTLRIEQTHQHAWRKMGLGIQLGPAGRPDSGSRCRAKEIAFSRPLVTTPGPGGITACRQGRNKTGVLAKARRNSFKLLSLASCCLVK